MIGSPIGTVLQSLGPDPAGEGAPTAPTIEVVNDGTGTSFTVTVTGSDEGSTNTIYYWTDDDDAPVEGLSRTGDGEKQQTGLSGDTWYGLFVVSAAGGYNQVATKPAGIYVTDGSAAAAGPISLPLDHLRTLVAASSTFQAWVGATGETEAQRIASAKEHVYVAALPAPIAAKRPFALVAHGDAWQREADTGGAGHSYLKTGSLYLGFEANVAEANQVAGSEGDAFIAFANEVGNTIADMEVLSGTGTYLNVTRISEYVRPRRAHPDEAGNAGVYYEAAYTIDWGP